MNQTDRINELSKALMIVRDARISCVGTVPAAWDFLQRVTEYLAREQRAAFTAAFSDCQEGAQ